MKKVWMVIGIIALGIFYLLALNNNLGVATDDAYYALLAESIATTGHYNLISFVDNPPGHATLPFFYPLMLSPIILIAGQNFFLMKLINVFLALASVILVYYIVKECANDKTAWWVAGLVAVNPLVFYFIHSVQSEIPYLFFTLLAIFFITKYAKTPMLVDQYLIGAVCALLVVYFTRTIGAALLVAAVLALAIRKGHKTKYAKAVLVAVICIAGIAWWSYQVTSVAHKGIGYFDEVLQTNIYGNSTHVSVGGIAGRIVTNGFDYLGGALVKDVRRASLADYSSIYAFVIIVGSIATIIILVSFITKMQRPSVIEWYVLLYVATLLIFPWASYRYLIPILPFLLMYLVEGAEFLFAIAKLNAKPIMYTSVIVVFVASIGASVHDIYTQRSGNDYPQTWKDYLKTAEYTKTLPAAEVVTTTRCVFFYVHAHHKCVAINDITTVDALLDRMHENNSQYLTTDNIEATKRLLGIHDPLYDVLDQIKTDARFEKIFSANESIVYKVA
jgi:4-amino-4-deoxy-L-arabinose transferase-like glycosyltransferase